MVVCKHLQGHGPRGATEPLILESKRSTPLRTELNPGLGSSVQQPGQRWAAGPDLAGCVILKRLEVTVELGRE